MHNEINTVERKVSGEAYHEDGFSGERKVVDEWKA